MSKKFLMLLLALCALVGTASAAEMPAAAPSDTPDGAPAANVALADAPLYGMGQTALASAGRGDGPAANCSAVASCHDGSTRSCSGSSTCTAVDSNCPNTRGYVRCDGATQYCPSCPPAPPSGPCDSFNNSYCTYTFNKFSYCCVPTWVAQGAYCPNICW